MPGGILTTFVALACLYLVIHLIKRHSGGQQVRLSLFIVSYSTTRLNRIFSRAGREYAHILRAWFTCGVIVAPMLAASISYILIKEMGNAAAWLYGVAQDRPAVDEGEVPGLALVLVLPGVTVPWAHALYLWCATAFSLGVHEAGHALAAAAEGVGIHAVSFFLLLLLPGAFVTLNTDNLAVLGPARALNVICAGVWHNVVLCSVCWLLVLALPLTLMPGYSTKHGAIIRNVPEGSALHGHFHRGDALTSVNGCQVTSCTDWIACVLDDGPGSYSTQQAGPKPRTMTWTPRQMLQRPVHQSGSGYCIPMSEQSAASLCSDPSEGSECEASQLCFVPSGNLSAAAIGASVTPQLWQPDQGLLDGVCLSAKSAASHEACRARGGAGCKAGEVCMQPVLANDECLYKIGYRRDPVHKAEPERWPGASAGLRTGGAADMEESGGTMQDVVMYAGSRGALLGAVEVTDYLPRLGLFPLRLPRMLEQLLEYTFKVSAALALINMAPVIYLDGQAALDVLVVSLGARMGEERGLNRQRWLQRARRWLLCAGTGGLVSILAVHALQLLGVEGPLRSLAAFVRRALPYLSRKLLT